MRRMALVFFLALAGGAVLIAAVLLASVFLAVKSYADPVQPPTLRVECMDRATLEAFARNRWQEMPVFVGPTNTGSAWILTLSEKASWTLWACQPTTCCLVVGGPNGMFLKGA